MHEHVDDVGARIEAVVPDPREDHGLRDDLIGMASEVLEQRVLAGTQIDATSSPCDGPRQEIDGKVGDMKLGRLAGFRDASEQRLNSSEELCEGEGLGEEVVAADVQAAHAIVDRPPCAQDQNRKPKTALP